MAAGRALAPPPFPAAAGQTDRLARARSHRTPKRPPRTPPERARAGSTPPRTHKRREPSTRHLEQGEGEGGVKGGQRALHEAPQRIAQLTRPPLARESFPPVYSLTQPVVQLLVPSLPARRLPLIRPWCVRFLARDLVPGSPIECFADRRPSPSPSAQPRGQARPFHLCRPYPLHRIRRASPSESIALKLIPHHPPQ